MKKNIKNVRIKWAAFFALLFIFITAEAQVKKAFTARYDQAVNGDVEIIANNVISRTATGNYNGPDDNHDFIDNVYVDIDNDATTFNSSSANFTNPMPGQNCLSVIKVYLYWAAADKEQNDGSDNQPGWNYNDVKIMLPGQTTYTTITADEVLYRGRDEHFVNDPYVCFKDITNSVLSLPTPFGKYQLANIEAKIGELRSHPNNGNTGTSGGWQIVFVYESPILPAKNITLFDGYAHVTKSKNNFNINFTGFHAPPTGNVKADVIIGALEGDRAVLGDRLQIKNRANTFVDISTPLRPANNFFNSKITSRGSDFLNRNPASTNTLGFDAALFKLNNLNNTIIANSQTSATLRMTSNQETYGMYLLGLSVDIWAANLNPIHLTVTNPGTVNPGGTIPFNFNIFNVGNDDVRNLVISTTLPPQVTLVEPINGLPAGVTYTLVGNTLTFFVQDGVADAGKPEINVPFNFLVNDECYFLETSCNLGFDLQFTAVFNGVQDPTQLTVLSSANIDSCGIGDNLPTHVNINQPIVSWLTPVGSLDRTIECNDAQGLINAQSLVPQADKCNFIPIKTSGAFVSNVSCPNIGTYTNTWTFTDACGVAIANYTQVITVQDTTAPIFNEPLPADITVECDAVPVAATLTASDCGTATVTYAETTTAGSCANNYTLTRVWTATDECGNSTSHTQVITVQDTTDPTFNEVLPADITVECDAVPVAATLTASDCGTATVTYNETTVAGGCANNYTLTRVWTATDECGNSTSHTQVITVQDTTAPTFNEVLPADITVECAAVPTTATLTASDACGTATVTYNETTVAGSCCANNYTLTRVWTATDECGNSTSHTQVITVQDTTAPTFNEVLPADITVECAAVPTAATLTASDACGTTTVTYNETTVAGSCANNYTLTRVWTATDECGNSISHTQVITVQDTTAPTLLNLPEAVITIACGTIPAVPTITAIDNCDNNVQMNYQETETIPNTNGNYVITRTWTFTDVCGNESIFVQIINVGPIDITTTVPSIDICIEDIAIDLNSYLVGVIDNNGTWTDDDSSGGLSGSEFDPSVVNIGTYHFTYTSSNISCNTTVMFIINVNDDCVVLPCSIEKDLKISKVVTPNDDSINDVFTLEGLEGCGFTFDVKIFNRWGKMVFESKDYLNGQKWDGKNFGGIVIGNTNQLPAGTYYYIVNVIGSGNKPRTGPIYLGSKN